jgi:hypothetical protein
MRAVTYLTDERDWSRGLDEAKSLETLRAVVAGWMPFVPDALAVVEQMDARDFGAWRAALAAERKGRFAGEDAAQRFGELMIPTALLRASMLARQLHVPVGAMLLRIQDLGKLAELLS